jgi:outer membrane biosynthesis protein TonB
MVKFDGTDMQRFAVSSIGALVLSAACVTAAVGPAKAATAADQPLSVDAWKHKVQSRLDRVSEPTMVYQPAKTVVSQVAVIFAANGELASTILAKSSGDRLVDARALHVARGVHYPAMPEGYRGLPTVVRMTLYFGEDAEAAAIRDQKKAEQNIQLAAL